jgi:hypothetical protein
MYFARNYRNKTETNETRQINNAITISECCVDFFKRNVFKSSKWSHQIVISSMRTQMMKLTKQWKDKKGAHSIKAGFIYRYTRISIIK